MSFDGIFLAGICRELQTTLQGGKVEKIYQPDSKTVMINVRSAGANHQLLISCHPTFARLHLTQEKKGNPVQPPLFCMVLRKHLTGGKIIAIDQPGLERLVEIKINCFNELGDQVTKTLVCEIMGKHSNIILLNESNAIIDAVKRIGHQVNRYREILPGQPYLPPPGQNKLAIVSLQEEDVAEAILSAEESTKLTNQLVNRFQGISPLLATELVSRCGLSLTVTTGTCGQLEIRLIYKTLAALAADWLAGSWSPCLVYDKKIPLAFAAIELTHLTNSGQLIPANFNETADRFYQAKETMEKLTQLKGNILQKITYEINKLENKLTVQQTESNQAQDCKEDKQIGQLLTANLYRLSPGLHSVTLIDYFDPEARTITVSLDPGLSPAQNAQVYFKRYRKSQKTIVNLAKQLKAGQEELMYLESIQTGLNQAATIAETEEIKQELIEEGYLSQPKTIRSNKTAPEKLKPYEFSSSDGLKILVGRNNRQNDWLTSKKGKDNDIWLHAKKIPGAHVLIKTENNKPVSAKTLYEGTLLAAYYSKARQAGQVPVDYTLLKHVMKPKGAKPGFVIYTGEQTIYAKTDDPWLISQGLDY